MASSTASNEDLMQAIAAKQVNIILGENGERRAPDQETNVPSNSPNTALVSQCEAIINASTPDVDPRNVGNYRLGAKYQSLTRRGIESFPARRHGTDDFYLIKILKLADEEELQTIEYHQGKAMMHNENYLLSILQGETGIIRKHELFLDVALEPLFSNDHKHTLIGHKEVRRLCLVLDCYLEHSYDPRYVHLTTLKNVLISEKKIPESVALEVFMKMVDIVERMHNENVVHRDIKLRNWVYNKETGEVRLVNFDCGKKIKDESHMFTDKCGHLVYVSPELLSGRPYQGKPTDMWALGVILYAMLFGRFPCPGDTAEKIKYTVQYRPIDIPYEEQRVSDQTVQLICMLLDRNAKRRITATEANLFLKLMFPSEPLIKVDTGPQVVPNCSPESLPKKVAKKRKHEDDSVVPFSPMFASQ